jgi:GDP-4-dehydro-6-deoxy-D-mannose reductase
VSQRILVTGAAGFAGGHLLDLLTGAASGTAEADSSTRNVVGWYRPGGTTPQMQQRVTFEAIDLLDRAAVRRAIARLKPDVVYHCAGAAHVGRAWDTTTPTFAVNVRATHYVLDALEQERVAARVLIPSSALVYATAAEPLTEDHPRVPTSPYGLSKLAQEMLSDHTGGGVSVAVARAFNHMGTRQSPMFAASGFARRIADIEKGRWEPVISVGNLDAQRDMTDVRDTVRAYRLIAERGAPGRAYNVCSGHAATIRDLLHRLIARARVRVAVRTDPARMRPNDVPLLVGDRSRIERELGWKPEIPLDRTLDDLLEYWREQP